MTKFNYAMLVGISLTAIDLASSLAYADSRSSLNQFATSWSGSFDQRRIGFFIEQITQDQVRGYSVVGANRQNFVGTVQPSGQGKYTVLARETGQPKTAGVFRLTLDLNHPQQIDASWQANQAGIKPKFFKLKPQQCRYNPRAGEFSQASLRLLKDDDLQLGKQELQYMRNEIYARHNYSFSNKILASLFAQQDWYMPCYLNVDKQLTAIERENIRRIKLIEPYAENTVIEWGR